MTNEEAIQLAQRAQEDGWNVLAAAPHAEFDHAVTVVGKHDHNCTHTLIRASDYDYHMDRLAAEGLHPSGLPPAVFNTVQEEKKEAQKQAFLAAADAPREMIGYASKPFPPSLWDRFRQWLSERFAPKKTE